MKRTWMNDAMDTVGTVDALVRSLVRYAREREESAFLGAAKQIAGSVVALVDLLEKGESEWGSLWEGNDGLEEHIALVAAGTRALREGVMRLFEGGKRFIESPFSPGVADAFAKAHGKVANDINYINHWFCLYDWRCSSVDKRILDRGFSCRNFRRVD